MSTISVTISSDNQVSKEISENAGTTMQDLIKALGTIKKDTNEYLTELVEQSKDQTTKKSGEDDGIDRILWFPENKDILNSRWRRPADGGDQQNCG